MSADSSVNLDQLDRLLIQALQLDGRLPFARIAAALGVSEQTAARRYRRLTDLGVVRVTGVENGWRSRVSLMLRIDTHPGSAVPVAEALAARGDVSWVSVATGDTEVTCALHTEGDSGRRSLIAERLPKLSRVVNVTSLVILHKFPRDPRIDWTARDVALNEAQIEELAPAWEAPASPEPAEPADEDRALIALLGEDGRRTVNGLASTLRRSESYVAGRVEALRADGRLQLVTAVAPATLGLTTTAMIWVTVPPSEIAAVGAELAAHREVTFVGAVSGAAGLAAAVACDDDADLYRYLTDHLGSIGAIVATEIVVDRLVKRRGAIIDPTSLRLV